ncbi:precorrin-2 C(20)-methyltransferase [Arsenicitalea aurantiaca]|uniref:Precorrin-2 C(20)-methyltransferase n=1 Tax=Arsenicitalea aurantiaca TaxID=1783274 RepID=A0A433X407_9HYPH|nr:precorrin-2 C(20)-methyltransferase [Arsenicitalea aurantiaca]RUT28781.1 precorrin-2 C(20)-methyltransferase [Arsenicitalea aurantiaca]
MNGTLYLVGVGPGDPELLTLKAARILGAVEVIAFPAPREDSALALEIASPHLNPDAARVPIPLPMSIDRAIGRTAYNEGAQAILLHLRAGRDVAYLCEGDPLFYGSAMYLIDRVGREAEICIVPGVTSLTASAAAIGRPLAARNEMLKVLPAPLPDAVLRSELLSTDAAALIKIGRHFDRIRALLEETGHLGGAMIVEHATTGKERITPLAAFAHTDRPYFSTILTYRGAEAWGR